MSDTCERLRTLAEALEGCEWELPLTSREDCLAAADEIERLRARVSELETPTYYWSVANFDTAKVTDMALMFQNCTAVQVARHVAVTVHGDSGVIRTIDLMIELTAAKQEIKNLLKEVERLRGMLPDPRQMSGWDDDGCPSDVAERLIELAEAMNIDVPQHWRGWVLAAKAEGE